MKAISPVAVANKQIWSLSQIEAEGIAKRGICKISQARCRTKLAMKKRATGLLQVWREMGSDITLCR